MRSPPGAARRCKANIATDRDGRHGALRAVVGCNREDDEDQEEGKDEFGIERGIGPARCWLVRSVVAHAPEIRVAADATASFLSRLNFQ
jgi:hypothetical protein